MDGYGYPEVYGRTDKGFCGHCGGRPDHSIHNSYGIFCGACYRWQIYIGPPQQWGDGMKAGETFMFTDNWETTVHYVRYFDRYHVDLSKRSSLSLITIDTKQVNCPTCVSFVKQEETPIELEVVKQLLWAKPFRKRCKARLRGDKTGFWGRCELSPHDESVDHALERGMVTVRWQDPRVELQATNYDHDDMSRAILL